MVTRRTVLLGGSAALIAGCGASSGLPTSEVVGDGFRLKGVTGVTQVAQLTGPDAINDTASVLLAGADLGSMFTVGDRTWFLFGDNFGIRPDDAFGGTGEVWKSNALAWTTDDDPTDGITFDGWVLDDLEQVKEIIPGLHNPNDGSGEVTKIPTQGWAIGEDLFVGYMSVKQWGAPGEWWANHAGLAHSSDGGQNWAVVEGLEWAGDSGFIQLAQHLVEDDGTQYLYLWGIPAGRFGQVRLMRVPADVEAVRSADAYEYFAGAEGDTARWSSREADAQVVLDAPCGELSVLWSEHLERWLLATMVDNGDAVLFEGLSPWGPWSEPHTITTQAETPGLYAPYLTPRYVGEDGRRLYFTFSIWGPYQVFWYSMDLVKD